LKSAMDSVCKDNFYQIDIFAIFEKCKELFTSFLNYDVVFDRRQVNYIAPSLTRVSW